MIIGSNSELEKCIILDMIRRDSTGNRSQFDRYLDIIFSAFGYHNIEDGEPTKLKDADAAQFAARLLNMVRTSFLFSRQLTADKRNYRFA